MAHRHRSNHTDIQGYQWCVDPYHCEPVAHGKIMETATCSCGAIRQSDLDGARTERSQWELPI